MAIWTVVVGDRPTVAFGATTEGDALKDLGDKYGVREDLMLLEDEKGQPLWNGDESELFIRQATPEEYRTWRRSYAATQDDPNIESMDGRDEPDEWLVFLVPVHDPNDDTYDDDD